MRDTDSPAIAASRTVEGVSVFSEIKSTNFRLNFRYHRSVTCTDKDRRGGDGRVNTGQVEEHWWQGSDLGTGAALPWLRNWRQKLRGKQVWESMFLL